MVDGQDRTSVLARPLPERSVNPDRQEASIIVKLPTRIPRQALALGPVLAVALSSMAQPPTSPPFREAQQITAVDLTVEIVSHRGPSKETEALPSYLAPEDFEVVYDGETLPVVGVSAFGPAQHAPDTEPWTFVIYFDRRLSSPVEAGWAAGELMTLASRLTDLGTVEVVAADPDPKPLAEPTRDAELLSSVLAEIALFPEGDDHQLLTLRDELLAEIGNPDSEIDPAELVPFAIAEEKRLVRRQLDALLTRLAVTEGGARRAVFLAGGGFDLHPEDFYRSHLSRSGRASAGESGDLEADTEALARTLAAYGWIVFPLVPPAEEVEAGMRLGKWEVGKIEGEAKETLLDPLDPHSTVGAPAINFFNLKRKNQKDLDRAEAYLELGTQLAKQGDLPEAEQAYRMALYHYAGDPAAIEEQTTALVKLGEALERQGRRREARRARERAQELDPDVVIATVPLGELIEPSAGLETLAQRTAGAVIADGEALGQTLTALPYRVRITYQVPGLPAGTLRPVEVRCKRRGCRLNAPGWARSGTPDGVAAARMRHWLASDQFEGELDVKARLLPGSPVSGPYSIEAEVKIPPGLSEDHGAKLRASLGFGNPESIATIQHVRLEPRKADGGSWTFQTGLASEALPATSQRGVIVLVEHMATGDWGATVVELPAAEP